MLFAYTGPIPFQAEWSFFDVIWQIMVLSKLPPSDVKKLHGAWKQMGATNKYLKTKIKLVKLDVPF